jgi:magnesium-transporting ATPase (P-type)
MRLSTVVLFSFYKNAVMAGVLITYSSRTLYSGTPLFDEWLIAALNFLAGMPIFALGAFDRCLEQDYVLKNPDTYAPTRRNELITKRTLLRWVILVFVHVFTIYYLTVPTLAVNGAGFTSAFLGLMSRQDPDRPGNGEGGDLKSVGFVLHFRASSCCYATRFCMNRDLSSSANGPLSRCWQKGVDAWPNRLSYTWVANGYLSIGFYLFAVYIYQAFGRSGPSSFSLSVDTVNHAFNTRIRTWMVLIFVPTAGMVFDITAKVFSNLFYPTQTQIHMEIFPTRGKEID